ncbi:hypothetical protein, partial [Rathayibacter rathayi]|uniref:hypothetical protein n=1 Tax=Rathayibacter rathayi TaxID=33887 RepID=UPI000D4ADED5
MNRTVGPLDRRIPPPQGLDDETTLPGAPATAPRHRARSLLLSALACTSVALTGALVPVSAQAVDVPAPTAHYDMSHAGSALLDISGNGRNATLTGLT